MRDRIFGDCLCFSALAEALATSMFIVLSSYSSLLWLLAFTALPIVHMGITATGSQCVFCLSY
jgi:hypothetical protein